MKQLTVKLGTDQIERFSKATAVQAIEELVWNGYDADAMSIAITVEMDPAGLGVAGLRVLDDGHGIPFDRLDKAFETIGDSVKLAMRKTPGGRMPRGRHGRGRFKAFALANTVQWISRYADGGGVAQFTIHGDKLRPQPFKADEPRPVEGGRSGVEVVIGPIDRPFADLLDSQRVVNELSKRLALGLVQHPIDIRYDGHKVNPLELIAHRAELTFSTDDSDGRTHEVSLTVIEWSGLAARSVYLCDADAVAQHEWDKFEVPAGRTFSFTAYAQALLVQKLVSSGAIDLGDLSPEAKALKAGVRKALDNHFRTRRAAQAGSLVEAWRGEEIYPYPDAEPNPVEKISREVFDACAQTVHDVLPGFVQGTKANRKMLFRLLKQAVETDSGSLCDILDQVLNLSKEQQGDLAAILKTTRLGAVIQAAKTVLDRLKFLEATEHLFYGPQAGDINEPHQLQQILLQELWLFGDDFAFGRQEARLKAALEQHAAHTGRAFDPETGAIKNILDGKASRLDILLNSTYLRTPPYDYEHLVVELKRSSVKLGSKELNQVESYALTVGNDDRFDKQRTKWTWYLIGVECDEFVEEKRMSQDRPAGLVVNRPGVQVRVKTWAEVVSAAKRSYEFFLKALETELTGDDGLADLKERHLLHLPPMMSSAERDGTGPRHALKRHLTPGVGVTNTTGLRRRQ